MSEPTRPRLFLVDGYALVYRAFHAVGGRPLTTSRGENTSIPWVIASFLDRLRRAHTPTYLGWVHDAGKSERDVRFAAYKSTRVKLEADQQADFDRGVERVGQLLAAHRVPLVKLPGFEADDVIATLAKRAHAEGIDTVVVSPDKDLVQLVQAGIEVLNPFYGKPGATIEKFYDLSNAAERLGVPPAQVTDYLALVGDTSDNVPGVKGIGDKGARDLLARWGSLEAIYGNIADVTPPRAKRALEDQADNARMSKELVTLRDDLGVALDLSALEMRPPDATALRALYVDLEFASLVRSLGDVAPATGAEPARPTRYRTVDTLDAVAELVARVRARGRCSVSIETELEEGAPPMPAPLRANLIGIAIGVGNGEACYVPFGHRPRGAQDSLALGDDQPTAVANLPPLRDPRMHAFVEMLEDATVRKVGHDAKYGMLVLRRAGVRLRGLAFDTMVASFLLEPGRRAHDLEALALALLQATPATVATVRGKGKQQVPLAEAPIERVRDYACAAADHIGLLHERFAPALAEQQLERLLSDLELPLIDVLGEMEWTGVAIDLTWFASLKSRFQAEREAAEREIWAAAGEEFNIQSTPKLREILFEKLGLPVKKRTASGPSTDASVLQELADEGHTLPVLLMNYRELSKLESTYIDALPVLVNPRTGRLHTSYSQTGAATGRLSSSDPNLQNIPIRSEVGRDIRRGFVPKAGWRFLAADYSQIELRLLAHLSNDPAFVDAFRVGGDIHRQTAAVIFEVPLDAVTSEMRARAKTINFATIYGQGPFSLSKQLKIDVDEARAFIARYFERFAGVRRFLDSSVAIARERGYAETIFGRRRQVPELRDRNFNVRAFGERVAQNSPIQGSAADLIKRAMIRIDGALRAGALESVMLLQVHDELVFEGPPHEMDTLRTLVTDAMEHAAELSVPLVVDIGIGNNWLDSKLH